MQLSHPCQREVWNKVLGHPVYCCHKPGIMILDRFPFLEQFEYLTELELFGGSFYRDQISGLLERRGRGLTRLHLISVASVDYRFVMWVWNLKKLLVLFETNFMSLLMAFQMIMWLIWSFTSNHPIYIYRAIARISQNCPNLEGLALTHCNVGNQVSFPTNSKNLINLRCISSLWRGGTRTRMRSTRGGGRTTSWPGRRTKLPR